LGEKMLLVPSIYKVVGNRGCNSYIIETNAGLVVIDVGFLGSEVGIRRYIETQLHASLDDVIYVVVTHAHRDVAEGAPDLLLYCSNAQLVVDKRDLSILKKITYIGEDIDIKEIEGDTYLSDADLRIISTPGHTPGSISILYGPSLFVGGAIYVSPEGISLPRQNYDKKMLVKSLRKLVELKFDSVFPSHGRYIRRGALQKLRDFMQRLGMSGEI